MGVRKTQTSRLLLNHTFVGTVTTKVIIHIQSHININVSHCVHGVINLHTG